MFAGCISTGVCVCVVTISLCSALLLHPSLPNAMSSLAHHSVARETAVLHQASHYSLCLLSMLGLLTTWACVITFGAIVCLDKRALIKFHIFLLTPEVAHSIVDLYMVLIHVPIPLAGVKAGFWKRDKTQMNTMAGLFNKITSHTWRGKKSFLHPWNIKLCAFLRFFPRIPL